MATLGKNLKQGLYLATAGAMLGVWLNPPHAAHASAEVPTAARQAIRFAEAQIGKPYLWGGTGPEAFDCSGLMFTAYGAAGISIPRTSQVEWAQGHKVSARHVKPGDLVFFAGSDGTPEAPGHVGLVIKPGAHLMVEAYATGFPIRKSHYGTPGSAPGDQVVVGFTRPTAGGRHG